MADLNPPALAEIGAGLYALEPLALEKALERRIHARADIGECIRTYLDALPKPEKPARVEPRDNPNRRTYVERHNAAGDARPVEPLVGVDFAHGIDALCAVTHTASWNAGWYHDPKTGKTIERNVGEVIALMHSELSEGLEGYRKGLMDDHLPHRLQLEVEFADAVIRIADTCGHLGLDLSGAIVDKMAYNATREDHKLEARAAGGKSF